MNRFLVRDEREIGVRDEREIGVDQAADRVSYLVLSFGLLAIVAYRSFVGGEASWDLLGLVVLGGLVGAVYRMQQRVVYGRWLVIVGVTIAIALVMAAVAALTVRT